MADKEERILIEVLGHRGCPVLSNNNICVLDYDCENCKAGLSRSEVIEKMAKVICASNMAPDCLWECETCDRWKESDKEAAEAVLNALLEDK